MSQYHVEYSLPPLHALSRASSDLFHPGYKAEKHDDSLSGSDDGNYAVYPDIHKMEADLEGVDDETNSALISQTLNADGTPKRPMNAFMIFARRRRPQVSAENQSMRTGEISKILSREWNAMIAHDKQFYLDQAKQLKDTFNNKYPDYVYRRRPNNSRKRRRTDVTSARRMENPLPTDGEYPVALEHGESSPTDGEDSGEPFRDLHYSRSAHELSHNYGDHKYGSSSQSRTNSHPYGNSDNTFRSNGAHDVRLAYSGSGRVNALSPVNPVSPRISQPLHYSYNQLPNHSRSTSNYNSEPVDLQPGSWQSRVERTPAVWPSQDRTLATLGSKYTPPQGQPWASTPPTSDPTGESSPVDFPFPTLNTPFFPNTSQLPGYQSQTSPVGTSPEHPGSPSLYNTAHLPPVSLTRDYGDRAYAPSPPISPGAYPSHMNQEALAYPQRHSSHMSRGGTSVPASYSSSTPHPMLSTGASGPAFWPRDKLDAY